MAHRQPMRRQPNLWRQLDATSRYIFPAGVLVFGLFVIGMPFGLPGQAALRPVYAMACVFFWSLYRPASLPAPFVAAIGLLLDLLGLTPLGLWAVLLLLLQGVTLLLRRRLAAQSFFSVWAVFCLLAAATCVLSWAAQSLLILRLLPAAPLTPQIFFAIGLYPAFAAFFIRAHRSAAAVELA